MESDKINALTKRDLDRKLDLEKRKQEKTNASADNEKLTYFDQTFSNKRTQIENLITKSKELSPNLLADHFNNISKEILLLQKYVAASNLFLRTYDIKKCQESLHELTTASKELEDELLPKKKFGFKNKTKKSETPAKTVDVVDFSASKRAIFSKELCGFTDKTDETLTMGPEEINKNDITAENLQNCTLRLYGAPSTLHLNHLKDCRIFTGPVSTSIFAENCVNCTLVIACQQLRLHSSENVDIYLHVTSRAIMEDCKKIFLAPYNWNYDNLEQDFKESGLDISTNHWKSVDDFNWLNEKQSPNWSIMEAEKIVTTWEK